MTKTFLDDFRRQLQPAIGPTVDTPARVEMTQRVKTRILRPFDRYSVGSGNFPRYSRANLRRNQPTLHNIRQALHITFRRREYQVELTPRTFVLPFPQGRNDHWRHRDCTLTGTGFRPTQLLIFVGAFADMQF